MRLYSFDTQLLTPLLHHSTFPLLHSSTPSTSPPLHLSIAGDSPQKTVKGVSLDRFTWINVFNDGYLPMDTLIVWVLLLLRPCTM